MNKKRCENCQHWTEDNPAHRTGVCAKLGIRTEAAAGTDWQIGRRRIKTCDHYQPAAPQEALIEKSFPGDLKM